MWFSELHDNIERELMKICENSSTNIHHGFNQTANVLLKSKT